MFWLTAVGPAWRWGRGGMVGCDMFAMLLRLRDYGERRRVVATGVCVSVSAARDFAWPGKRLVSLGEWAARERKGWEV